MKNLFLLFLVSMVAISGVKSQSFNFNQDLDEIVLLNINAIELGDVSLRNISSIEQVGNFNEIKSVQENLAFNPNIILLQQSGEENVMWVDQRGINHEVLFQQIGDLNLINFVQRGGSSEFIIGQSGTGNVIDTYMINNYGDNFSGKIKQEGNLNQVDLLMNGGRAIEFFQKGDNHSINAIVIGEDRALKIFQDSGMVGEGMRVNVFTGN